MDASSFVIGALVALLLSSLLLKRGSVQQNVSNQSISNDKEVKPLKNKKKNKKSTITNTNATLDNAANDEKSNKSLLETPSNVNPIIPQEEEWQHVPTQKGKNQRKPLVEAPVTSHGKASIFSVLPEDEPEKEKQQSTAGPVKVLRLVGSNATHSQASSTRSAPNFQEMESKKHRENVRKREKQKLVRELVRQQSQQVEKPGYVAPKAVPSVKKGFVEHKQQATTTSNSETVRSNSFWG